MATIRTSIKATKFRVGIYGGGGLGKTTLASMAPGALIINIEGGLGALPGLKEAVVDNWVDLRNLLRDSVKLAPFDTIVLDTITKAEDEAVKYVCTTYPIGGQPAASLADYDWGKGNIYLFEEMKKLLNDLECLYAKGKNIVIVAHEELTRAPNAAGEDFLRYEMRLQNSPKCNVRAKVKEWLDVLAHVSFDLAVDNNKAKDTKSRAIFTEESPIRMAKCRGKIGTLEYKLNDNTFWKKLFEG